MLDQLNDIISTLGKSDIIENANIPNDKNQEVINQTGQTIVSSLKTMVSDGQTGDLIGLFSGKSKAEASNPIIKTIISNLTSNLIGKVGLPDGISKLVSSSIVPKVLGSLIGKANDSKDSSFEISDLLGMFSSGDSKSGLLSSIAKIGLDKDGDGEIGIGDALSALTSKSKKSDDEKGGIGDVLGGLFGK